MEKLISEFSSGLFFWQTVIFVTLIFLLRKYAWKPILDAVNEREKSIRDSLNSAKEAKKEMENLQAENKKILQEITKAFINAQPSIKTLVEWSRADKAQSGGILTFADGDLIINNK
mgnify:FL=1